MDSADTGRAGEDVAARHLKRRGFRITGRNVRLGRLGELDIVAEKRGVLVIVEVKSKLAGEGLGGLVNITAAKQRKLADLAQAYLMQEKPACKAVRFDAIEVEFTDEQLKRSTVRHIEDAFRLN